jgi:lambda family phage minor tail protein L
MAYAAWVASNPYTVGQIARATTVQASGLVFRCTVAGTSAATEPAWPTDIGSTIVDGGVTWAAISSVYEELSVLAPSAVIELFELEINAAQHGANETYYFHAGVNATNNANIIWNSQAYVAFPIEATDFEYTGTGSLPRPKLRISNIFGNITGLILSLPNGLEGAKVTRIRTLARYIDGVNFPGGTNPYGTPDPTAEFPREIYYIDRKAAENRDLIEFELASAFDLVGVRVPKRQCVSNVCQWTYRGLECGYAGNAYFNFNDQPVAAVGQDVCGKRLRSCELRFGQQRRTGSVITGSNILTLAEALNFDIGTPVTGFGLPSSTVTTNTNTTLITLNQNAVASTSRSTTGTVQANLTQIIVTDATGIAPGMTVTGLYLAGNTQVTAVSGTTVTISPPVPVTTAMLTLTATITTNTAVGALYNRYNKSSNEAYFATSAAISVGWYAASSLLPLSRLAQVTSIGQSAFGNSKAGLTLSKVAFLSQTYTSGITNIAWSFYVLGSISSAAYAFSATDQNYTFRANAAIPYGSYPGVGMFST